MRRFVKTVLTIGAFLLYFAGCASINEDSSEQQKAPSKMGYKIECFMGKIRSIQLYVNGPGIWELDKDELGICDGNDRT
jgi:hypothetical protein